jgi:predicted TIM-barrel fold metal-dependent hydrolase
MNELQPGTQAWLDQVTEDIIDPERPIIDPHHHLWKRGFGFDYMLDELWQDTGSGHNIEKTVFIECHAFYNRDLPEHLKSTGETKAVAEIAKLSQDGAKGQATIAGIIPFVNLSLAGESEDLLKEAIALHQQQSNGLLRGFRHSGAYDKNSDKFFISPRNPSYLYGQEPFRKGLRILAEHGLTYDTWHYHPQNQDFYDLAQAVPQCTMVLDHFGTPLGVGPYAGCRDEIFQQWQQDIKDISRCENVYAKLGGLAMPDNGFGWNQASMPPDSDEFVAKQRRYYLHTIECFGPERCMFESNFPVDRFSLSYPVVWNGFKKMVADFSEEDKHAMFYGTAEKVYKLHNS